MRFSVSFRYARVCIGVCALLWASRALAVEADARQRSVALFTEGGAAGKAGDYTRAEAAFRTSYALHPSGSTLRNLALTEMHLGKMVEALGGYGEFVEKPDEIKPAIERAMKSGKPSLVNVCTDPEAQATTDMGFSGY